MTDAAIRAATAAAIRASVERGNFSLVVRDRPVGLGIDAGQRIRAANWPTLPTVTGEAVADDLRRADAQLDVVVAEPDGLDAGMMEHVRQSRLRIWQTPPAA